MSEKLHINGVEDDSIDQHDDSISSEWQKMAKEAKNEKNNKFPDVKVNDGDIWRAFDEQQIVLKWLADNTNEDGSWKIDDITIPEEWEEFIERQLEAKKEIFEESQKQRNETIEWIKTSKNIDVSLEDINDFDTKEKYSELSDEQKESVQRDKDKIVEAINPFLEGTNSASRIGSLISLVRTPLISFVSKYGDGIIADSTADIIAKQSYRIASDASETFPDDGELRVGSDEYTEDDDGFSKKVERGAKDLSDAIKVADLSKNDQAIDVYMDVVIKNDLLKQYAILHGIDDKRADAFFENVVPLIDKKDLEVSRLWSNPEYIQFSFANPFSNGTEFRAGDFCIHALTSEINPTNTQELLLALRDVSADTFAAYEQNRSDAFEIEGVLLQSRSFIHRESPGEHEILSSMLKFYNTKGNPEEHAIAKDKLRDVLDKYGLGCHSYASGDYMFDLDNYEKVVGQRGSGGQLHNTKEKAVDALRRLVENTDPKILDKPKVSDTQLNDLIQNMYLSVNKQSGEAYVDFKEVGKIVRRMNELLKDRQGTTGIKPSEVKTLAFVERVATFAVRNINEKEKRELPFDSDFKEMCRFAELTSQNGEYDESDFESFWKKFEKINDFDDKNELAEHFKMLSQRRLSQLNGLTEKTPFLKRKADALWSGNLNDELLRL